MTDSEYAVNNLFKEYFEYIQEEEFPNTVFVHTEG